MNKKLHIIAFNIPYPPNYGGIIDVYYKIKALHALGVGIILHCFEYERKQCPELNEVCEKVFYYKRNTGFKANLTFLPYNVYSRKHPELINRLLQDDYPILFEGLHTCYYLNDKRLNNRIKICRTANIEHDYYRLLSKSESSFFKKIFFTIEALRFKRYEPILKKANHIIAVSTSDQIYLQQTYPDKRVTFIPCFHENEDLEIEAGCSDFVLYHAKLSVPENTQAALYLIRTLFSKLSSPCIIAGMNPPECLYKAAGPYKNIQIEANPSAARMKELIRKAQVHALVTFQPTGLKLKLLNSLFAGRHLLVNPLMLNGSGLDSLCTIAETEADLQDKCIELLQTPFDQKQIELRRKLLFPQFSNKPQAERLYKILYDGA